MVGQSDKGNALQRNGLRILGRIRKQPFWGTLGVGKALFSDDERAVSLGKGLAAIGECAKFAKTRHVSLSGTDLNRRFS
jgi:hypothetical protein